MMMKMMKMSNMMNDHSSSSYHSDDNDMYDMFSEMLDSSSDRMDNYRSSDYSNQMGRMSHFKNMFNNMRYKRAAGDNLDLGDRLVEKLAEQKHHMEAKIGNMTCVMKELNVLDASNNIDVQAMKRDSQDRQHDLCHEGVERLGRQQQHRCAGHEEGHPEVHDAQRVVQEQVRAPA